MRDELRSGAAVVLEERFCRDDAMLLMVCCETPGTTVLPGIDATAAVPAITLLMSMGRMKSVGVTLVSRLAVAAVCPANRAGEMVSPDSFSNDECREVVDGASWKSQ